jgi:hypothetical protein
LHGDPPYVSRSGEAGCSFWSHHRCDYHLIC